MPLKPEQQAMFKTICDRIANGESLRSACKHKGSVHIDTIRKWLRDDETGELNAQYARAREEQAEVHADQILEVSRDESLDVNRARLIADNMRWIASKLKPKVYGDKVNASVDGSLTLRIVRDDPDAS